MEWPDFFPQDCPPDDAQPAAGEFYRFVNKNIPKERDFVSHLQRKPDDNYKDLCRASGLSIYKDIKDAIRLWRVSSAFRKKKLAKGLLYPELGSILHTPSREKSHHTWWLCIGTEPWNVFHVVEIPEE